MISSAAVSLQQTALGKSGEYASYLHDQLGLPSIWTRAANLPAPSAHPRQPAPHQGRPHQGEPRHGQRTPHNSQLLPPHPPLVFSSRSAELLPDNITDHRYQTFDISVKEGPVKPVHLANSVHIVEGCLTRSSHGTTQVTKTEPAQPHPQDNNVKPAHNLYRLDEYEESVRLALNNLHKLQEQPSDGHSSIQDTPGCLDNSQSASEPVGPCLPSLQPSVCGVKQQRGHTDFSIDTLLGLGRSVYKELSINIPEDLNYLPAARNSSQHPALLICESALSNIYLQNSHMNSLEKFAELALALGSM